MAEPRSPKVPSPPSPSAGPWAVRLYVEILAAQPIYFGLGTDALPLQLGAHAVALLGAVAHVPPYGELMRLRNAADSLGITRPKGRRSWRSSVSDTGTVRIVFAFGGLITAFAFLLKERSAIAGLFAIAGVTCLLLGGVCLLLARARRPGQK